MKKGNLISLSSRLSEFANRFIVEELKKAGLGDISVSHGDIFAVLFDGNAYEMSAIAKKINRTKPTVTVLVEKLEKLGFVIKAKDEDDARIVKVYLSEKGLALKPTFKVISSKLNEKAYKNLSEAQSLMIEEILEQTLHNFS